MAYRWKPSASQRRAFAERMQNPAEKAQYEQRKLDKEQKRRASSKFDYNSAGGNYIPTQSQYNHAFEFAGKPELTLTAEQLSAIDMVMYGYTCQEKVHHDYIHIVNELIRSTHHE